MKRGGHGGGLLRLAGSELSRRNLTTRLIELGLDLLGEFELGFEIVINPLA